VHALGGRATVPAHQRRPFPANPLSKAVPPTWISMTPPGQRRRRLFW